VAGIVRRVYVWMDRLDKEWQAGSGWSRMVRTVTSIHGRNGEFGLGTMGRDQSRQ